VPIVGSAVGLPSEFEPIRNRSAKALFELALRALSSKTAHYALADECLRAVIGRDADHAEARRLLGFVRHDDGWATPYAVQQIKLGKVLHSTYGWVPAAWVPHLELGQLPAMDPPGAKQTRWLPAKDANALRDSIRRPWRIETEHFLILTDASLSEAIAFGRQLEDFDDLFFSLLADVIADDLPLARRFREKGATPRPISPALHTIYYFASQQEYVDYLQPIVGADIAETLGYYDPPTQEKRRSPAFFFRDPGGRIDVSSTLFHEVSHQLLFERTKIRPTAFKKNTGNFWVFEGLGTYFETVVAGPGGTFEVGGFVGARLLDARERIIGNGEFVPCAQFVRFGQADFLHPERKRLHYAEAEALTVFLMHTHSGRYREGFLDYVRDALRGRLQGDLGRALDDRIGISYKELDEAFLADLKVRNQPSR
jgi:hypothetical protein